MTYLVDTNIIIFFFRGKFDLKEKFKVAGIENCFISEITLAELKYGALCSQDPEKHLNKINRLLKDITVLPISTCLDVFVKEKARLRKAGTMIDDFDLLIGATAMAGEFILVTNNVKHFNRLENIRIEDWVNT